MLHELLIELRDPTTLILSFLIVFITSLYTGWVIGVQHVIHDYRDMFEMANKWMADQEQINRLLVRNVSQTIKMIQSLDQITTHHDRSFAALAARLVEAGIIETDKANSADPNESEDQQAA